MGFENKGIYIFVNLKSISILLYNKGHNKTYKKYVASLKPQQP